MRVLIFVYNIIVHTLYFNDIYYSNYYYNIVNNHTWLLPLRENVLSRKRLFLVLEFDRQTDVSQTVPAK